MKALLIALSLLAFVALAAGTLFAQATQPEAAPVLGGVVGIAQVSETPAPPGGQPELRPGMPPIPTAPDSTRSRGPFWGGNPFAMGGGGFWMGGGDRDPEIFRLIADIVTLQMLNRAELSARQIRQVLPVLKDLVAKEKQAQARVRQGLLARKKALLKATSTAQASDDRTRWQQLSEMSKEIRTNSEAAQSKLGKILRPEQLKALEAVLWPLPPTGMGRGPMPGPALPGGPRASEPRTPPGAAPSPEAPIPGRTTAPRGEGMRPAGERPQRGRFPGMISPIAPSGVTLERVVALLEEKLAALSEK